MANAYAVTNESGHTQRLSLTVGTGGHGDTPEIYTETLIKRESYVNKTKLISTKTKDEDGNMIYEKVKTSRVRAKTLFDIASKYAGVHDVFSKMDLPLHTEVKCFDLFKWQMNKDKKWVEVKKGLSFEIGEMEVRLIKNKHSLFFKGKPVRTFKGKL